MRRRPFVVLVARSGPAPGARLEEGFQPNRDAAKQLSEYLEGKRLPGIDVLQEDS